MAIEYSGGTLRNDQYAGVASYLDLLDNIDTTLVAAGWTSALLNAFNNALYTGQPQDGGTIGLNGVVYTFQSAINNAVAREVLIGADEDESWANFIACVNAAAGSGTLYSSASTIDANFTASLNSLGSVRFEAKVLTGPTGNGIVVTEICDNMTWEFAGVSNRITAFGGYEWTSAAAPSGMICRVLGWIRDFDSGDDPIQVRFILADATTAVACPAAYASGSLFSDVSSKLYGARLGSNSTTLPASTWRVIANKYQFFAMADTLYSGGGIFVSAGVPWIPDFLYPKVIQTATATTPVVVTTTAVHGWTTGNVVSIAGIEGLEGANGNFTVTVLSTTTAELDTSVGSGLYTSGGVAAKVNVGLATALWMVNSFTGTNTAFYTQIPPTDYVGQILNGSINDPNGTYGTGTFALVAINDTRLAEGANSQLWYNTDVLASEPLISMGVTNAGTSYLIGQLWNSFFHSKAEPGGTTGTFDSKNWYILTDNATGSTTEKEGALVLQVP